MGAADRREPAWSRAIRWLGWTLIAAGVLVGLFIVYLLYWTGLETDAAQREMLATWDARLDDWELDLAPDAGLAEVPIVTQPLADDEVAAAPPPDAGSAYAVIWFERDGERIITEQTLSVVQGVSDEDLTSGPGHYPTSDAPGQAGNFAISGHRTTYSAPFYNLERLEAGDEIHVIDREGRRFVYDYVEQVIVAPNDVWVLDDDPLELGDGAYMTITTCHPRFSARQRLIAFGELRTGPA